MCAKEYRVPATGGLFHTHKVQYSKETHALLKQLIEESKLSIKQRKSLCENIKNGEPLPLPKTTRNDNQLKKTEFIIPPAFQKRRSLDTILQSGAYERDTYSALCNIGNSQKEKIRLQNLMAYGKELPQENLDLKKRLRMELKDKEEIDLDEMFDYLLDGIRERIVFLKEMEALGEVKAYSTVIKQEIASRLQQMKQISPDKCKQLDIYGQIK